LTTSAAWIRLCTDKTGTLTEGVVQVEGAYDADASPSSRVLRLAALAGLGVSVTLITGDSKLVAQPLASLVGLPSDTVLTGRHLDDLHDEALERIAEQT
jgi:magnesium-transporting ATPase (P-type)